eukprot:3502337-Lingulodinium_polyedra.AAC.1
MALHQREEVEPVGLGQAARSFPQGHFTYARAALSIDASSLLLPATWPTFNAQSMQGISADAALLRLCYAE